MLKLVRLASRTLAEAVTNQLREAILTGELKPGQPLWQEQLADRFNVSRVPIREALRHLAAEGLVTLQSHHSAVVTALSKDEVEELVVIAATLDLAAVGRAIARINAGDLAQMKRCLTEMKKNQDKPEQWLALNLEFHLITIRAAGWSRIESLAIDSRRNIGRYVSPVYEQSVHEWDRQHGAIYQAFAAGDEARVKREIEVHWKYTVQSIVSTIGKDEHPKAVGQS